MAADPKRIQILKALLRFGGSSEVPKIAEASFMPDSGMEQGVGYQWDTPESEDQEDDQGSDESEGFYQTKKKKLKKIQMRIRR